MIHFSLNFNTVWGESLVLRVGKKVHAMHYAGNGRWEASLNETDIRNRQEYVYALQRDGKTIRYEWRVHTFRAPQGAKEIVVLDRWINRPHNSAFWASAFKDVIFGRDLKPAAPIRGNIVLRTTAAEIRPGEVLAIAGNGPLGD